MGFSNSLKDVLREEYDSLDLDTKLSLSPAFCSIILNDKVVKKTLRKKKLVKKSELVKKSRRSSVLKPKRQKKKLRRVK